MGARRKATFYVDESIHKALRLKAANDDVSPSDLLNDLLANDLVEYLEDLEDIKAVKARQKERGKGIPLEQFVKKLAKNG
ncbi:MAG: CopG family transcriptional regulator [Bdellovibrio sp.]